MHNFGARGCLLLCKSKSSRTDQCNAKTSYLTNVQKLETNLHSGDIEHREAAPWHRGIGCRIKTRKWCLCVTASLSRNSSKQPVFTVRVGNMDELDLF
jgi:hypothetical protein